MNEQPAFLTNPKLPTQTVSRPLRILFLMRHFMYLRNYESTLRALAARGHSVILGYEEMHEKVDDEIAAQAQYLADEVPNIELRLMPTRRDRWAVLAHQMRSFRNYCRYLTPRFQQAVKCAKRAESHLMPQFRKVAALAARHQALPARIARHLAWLEYAMPLDRDIVAAIRSVAPDVVAVTPFIDFSSTQVEYVKAARALGIASIHCVASWDNLTNKGLVLVPPDAMLVWNEAQKAEAQELHDMPVSRVKVTGAQLFDDWFACKPSRDRETFCREVGLDPQQPFILYTCSSVFIARYESDFFTRWLEALREAQDENLRDVGVLVRPHPGSHKYAAQWDRPEIAAGRNVRVFPREGGYPVTDAARADYFDSLYHSVAVVGINTSAMLEAGILGKQCFTVLDAEIAESQEGMLHFSHLTAGNFLVAAHNFEEHIGQLTKALSGDEGSRQDRDDFIAEFLRPHGRSVPATPFVVDAIEQLAEFLPERLKRWPLIFAPLLLPWAALLHYVAARRTTKKWDKVSLTHRFAYEVHKSRKWLWRYGVHRPSKVLGRTLRGSLKAPKDGLKLARKLTRRVQAAVARRLGSG